MPIGLQAQERDRLALLEHRQHALLVVVAVLLAGVLVGGLESGEERDGARGRELHVATIRCRRTDAHRGGGDARISHLRGDRALPDHVVERELVSAQLTLDVGRQPEAVTGRADRLVRLLRVLDLAVIAARSVGHVVGAEELAGLGAGRIDGLLRQCRGVGTHIGDVATLVETLRDAHRALGIPTEASRGLLLESRGHERRVGTALAGLLDDRAHGVGRPGQGGGELEGSGLAQHQHVVLARQAALVGEVLARRQSAPLHLHQARAESTGIEGGR